MIGVNRRLYMEIEGKITKGVVGDAWKYIRDTQSGRAA